MENKINKKYIKKLHSKLKLWKPIHLCWLFEKFDLPIPPYLIGAATGTAVLAGSRIANSTRTWQEDEDIDVAAWVKTNDFIFAASIETQSGKKTNKNLSLRWRNKTEAGSFTALSGAGELTWNGITDLVNDNALTSGEAGCTPSGGQIWIDGIEREGANQITFDTSNQADRWSEYQWAIDCSGAQDGDEYEFEIYNDIDATPIGT